jgi:D-tyrosyl-tRNA(Tyr) deacylase
MRVVLQRVLTASVSIDGALHAAIDAGFLLLLGIEHEDTVEDAEWLCKKISAMRVFSDEDGLMNQSIQNTQGSILVISQFTLFASTKKGNRPSFIRAARPEVAVPLYETFVQYLATESSRPVYTGVFGADMQVSLVNDGPVTILMDSKARA